MMGLQHGNSAGCRIQRLLPAFVFAVGFAVWAQGMTLTRDGSAVAVLVIPDDPLPVVEAAASELVHHLQKASGARLDIVAEESAPEGVPIVFLGATEAANDHDLHVPPDQPNAFLIKRIDDQLFLLGDDSAGQPFWILHNNRTRVGTLFAVYEFLERHLDVYWIWPGESGEVVPSRPTITVPRWDQVGAPAMVHTRWRDGPAAGTDGWADQDNRGRFINDQARWLRRHRFALGINLDVRHAFTGYWDRYGESHPEFFNQLPDGTRRPDPTYWGGSPRLVSMCPSEPGLHQEVVQRFVEKPMNPDRLYVDASENDTPGKCVCERCLSWDVPAAEETAATADRLAACRDAYDAGDSQWYKPLGSLTDRYCRFWRAVQDEARKHDPNAVVLFHGYANYREPPRQVKLNRQMINSFVPQFLFPWSDEAVRQFRQDWLGWVEAGCSMMLRPNYLDCGHNFPIFYARRFGEEFNFAWTHGMMSTDYDALPGQYATQGLNHYVVARLNNRPDMPVHQVFQEFLDAFGPAREAVAAYMDLWERVSAAVTPEQLEQVARPHGLSGTGSALYADFYMLAPALFRPEIMTEAHDCLRQAKEQAEGQPLAEQRVQVLVDGLRNVELTLATQQAYQTYRQTGDLQLFADALAEVDDFRAGIETSRTINMHWLHKWEQRHWDRTLVRMMTRQPGERLPDPWQFAWDPEKEGEARGWHLPETDDSEWQSINTDAAWEEQTVGKQWAEKHRGQGYDGLAWYRTTFVLDQDTQGQRVSLLFGAVDEACTIWINGEKILERPYPYRGDRDSWQKAFDVDISDHVRIGAPNQLAVRVEDNTGAGGIWKSVWLQITEPLAGNAENRVRNGGFEDGESSWKRHVMGGEYAFAIDRTAAHSGAASARLTCTALATPEKREKMRCAAWARWYQHVPVVPDARYRLRLWIKTDPAFSGRVVLYFTGDKAKKTRSEHMLGTNGIWRELLVEGYEAAGDSAGVFLNVMDGTGSVWFDDVEVVPLD